MAYQILAEWVKERLKAPSVTANFDIPARSGRNHISSQFSAIDAAGDCGGSDPI